MANCRSIGSVLAFIIGVSISAFPQPQQSQDVEFQSAEPFKIAPGSSFSAAKSEQSPINKSRISAHGRSAAIVSDISEAMNVIENHHASTSNERIAKATSASMKAMLRSLDPHSNYFDASEFAELLGEHRSEYIGTGSTIVNFEKGGSYETYILGSAGGSAAEAAGLRFGDRIVSVQGTSVGGIDSYKVREMIRGPAGTSLTMVVERANSGGIETITLKRQRISQPSVSGSFVTKAGVGFINASMGFGYSTVSELRSSIEILKAKGMTSLVLDLRGNGGGIVDQAVATAEVFLPLGSKILSQRGRLPGEDRAWFSRNQIPEDLPLVLLVDRDTASAAEIVAGALQDNDRAIIVGERTFGKGLVQNVLELPQGAGMTLTSARYYTPSGRTIQRDYTDIGLYDYYKQTTRADLIDRSAFVARTITDRRVYGGNGIEPDIALSEQVDESRYKLLDPLFFFARDIVNGRIGGQVSPEQLRQNVIFGRDVIDDRSVAAFIAFLDSNVEWQSQKVLAKSQKDFVASQLRYFVSLGLFGQDVANRARVADDHAFSLAQDNLTAAGELAARARIVREARRRKKSSPK